MPWLQLERTLTPKHKNCETIITVRNPTSKYVVYNMCLKLRNLLSNILSMRSSLGDTTVLYLVPRILDYVQTQSAPSSCATGAAGFIPRSISSTLHVGDVKTYSTVEGKTYSTVEGLFLTLAFSARNNVTRGAPLPPLSRFPKTLLQSLYRE